MREATGQRRARAQASDRVRAPDEDHSRSLRVGAHPKTTGAAGGGFWRRRGRFLPPGAPLRTLLAPAARAEQLGTCHPVKRSVKPLRQHTRRGHSGGAPTGLRVGAEGRAHDAGRAGEHRQRECGNALRRWHAIPATSAIGGVWHPTPPAVAYTLHTSRIPSSLCPRPAQHTHLRGWVEVPAKVGGRACGTTDVSRELRTVVSTSERSACGIDPMPEARKHRP